MVLAKVKEKLHDYIDHADGKKLQAIYTLLERDIEDQGDTYDDATLNFLRQTSNDYKSGKTAAIPADESIRRIKKQLKKREL